MGMRKDKYISELITIYRRFKKGTQPEYFHVLNNVPFENEEESQTHGSNPDTTDREYLGKERGVASKAMIQTNNFAEYKNLHLSKYIYFDTNNTVIHSPDIYPVLYGNDIIPGKRKGVKSWLNIFDPQDVDFEYLKNNFNVNLLTIEDLQNGSKKEKVEFFTDYTFIVLKLIGRTSERLSGEDEKPMDMNFNILLFKNHVITTHDKIWPSVTDTVNFLSLVNQKTHINGDWVFLSVIIELLQDVSFYTEMIAPRIEKILVSTHMHYDYSHHHPHVTKNSDHGSVDIGDLKRNFALTFELIDLQAYIKPKMEILNELKKGERKFDTRIRKYLSISHQDFLNHSKEISESLKTLERSQDLLLALINVDMTKEGNNMNRIMKRFTFLTLIFLPIQTIAALWGMNCKVPWQFGEDNRSLSPFFILIFLSIALTFIYYTVQDYLVNGKNNVKDFVTGRAARNRITRSNQV